MPFEPKSKAERVRDAVEILSQLKEVGISPTDPSYLETKQHLDAWIADGEARTVKIPFPRALRTGHMMLPRIAGRPASFLLKATPELKWKLREQDNV